MIIFSNQKKIIYRLHDNKPIELLINAAKVAGVEGKIGTHTLRKTFGYHALPKRYCHFDINVDLSSSITS